MKSDLQSRVELWMQAMGLPEGGDVAAAEAGFCWDDDDLFAVVNARRLAEGKARRKAGLARDARLWSHADYKLGACEDAEWMQRPRYTPEALFAERCFAGSMPRGDDFVRLLEQFARIKECHWARTMLAALADPDPVEYDLTTYDPDRPDLWVKERRVMATQA